jgi:hypothetical protein
MENTIYGEYFDNEESVKEAIVKAVIILNKPPLLLKSALSLH